MDANGIANVSAKDLDTRKEQGMVITGGASRPAQYFHHPELYA